MNILFDINHPGQVHLFRNSIKELEYRNHKVVVTIKNIPSAIELLKHYQIEYIYLGEKSDKLWGKGFNQLKYDLKLWKILKSYKIDLAIGSSITVDHASFFCRTKSLHFSDDDPDVVPFVVKYAHPFTDNILCPDCLDFPEHKEKVIQYSGYHELAYLHPKRFKPDPSVLSKLNLIEEEPFFILRFNVFKAHHDVGNHGLSLAQKLLIIDELKQKGRIFITTEREIEPELKKYQLRIPPEDIHSLLSFSSLFIGDSQTMTSEAAVLGIPSIRCNTFAGRISYLEEEEKRYDLTYAFLPNNFDLLLVQLRTLLSNHALKNEWQTKRRKMLEDKIDVTAFMVWFFENYPKSVQIMKENPDYQFNFR
jgi:uncharacterized protein